MSTNLRRDLLAAAPHNPQAAARTAATLGEGPPERDAAPGEAGGEREGGATTTKRRTSIVADRRCRSAATRSVERLITTAGAATELVLWFAAARAAWELASGFGR